MKLIFATNNLHKLEEARAILSSDCQIFSLADIGCFEDIAETADTLEGNSLLKAQFLWQRYSLNCFADDTGLEVEALNGAPGVYSARYAGIDGSHPTPAQNRHKLLEAMKDVINRSARFRTVVTIIINGKAVQVDGCVNGSITTEERGEGGFGYDSVFIPEGYNQTFAELGEEIKNNISHRAKAMNALAEYLQTNAMK